MSQILYVSVQFKNYFKNTEYDDHNFVFKYDASKTAISIGDLVVCETRYGLSLGKVVRFDTELPKIFSPGCELKEIVSVVDLTEYNERKARKEKAEVLKKEMEERMSKLKEIELIRMMSEKDETLKNMLKEYEELMEEK